MPYALAKSERLTSQLVIDKLFAGGNASMAAFPLRIVFMQVEKSEKNGSDEPPVSILVSVPKKRFRHAVDRNRVKRQVREAFRQHKDLLCQVVPEGQRLLLAFICLSDEHRPSKEIEGRIVSLMRRISEKI